jgi:hypothetical protein
VGLEDGGKEEGEPFGGITVLPSSSGLFGKGCVDEVFLRDDYTQSWYLI